MSDKIKLAIGIIIIYGIIEGFTIYNDYQVNHNSPSGFMIEKNIEMPDFDEIFTPAKGK